MLTADLVDVRKKGSELVPRRLDADGKSEARMLASHCLDAAHANVGARREELEAAWGAICAESKRPKLAAAIRKLVEDGCTFEAEEATSPVTLRRTLFSRAAEIRAADREEKFDRARVVREVAETLSMTPEELERALFSDLRNEHLLRAAPTANAESIVEAYELGQAQAILLRAVRITCMVHDFSPGALRAFFAKLKFHKLLFSAERVEDGGYRVVVDGPFSMFDAVTRYGLRLALLLPALRALETWSLEADVRWGNEREPLVFRLSSPSSSTATKAKKRRPIETPTTPPDVHLADDVREVLEGLRKASTTFDVKPATALLDVPGFGVCIPDLVLTPKTKGDPIYVEILGFWSRDAVFRRIELVERGASARIVFAVSSRLRVSEELLDASSSSALYVYQGKINARALLERIENVAKSVARSARASSTTHTKRVTRSRNRP